MKSSDIHVPLTVPKGQEAEYIKNFKKITQNSGRLMLFAGDQRVEHLNGDFYGKSISQEDADPEHLFQIASKANIGVFATQLGYLAKYGRDYKSVPYLVKVNSKTNIVPTSQADPHSFAWYQFDQILQFKKQSGLNILGLGYTIYLGSEHETQMLYEAAQLIYNAHQHGMVVVLWIYPRGKAVIHEKDAHLIAGAANVAGALGADFVKVNFPETLTQDPYEAFKEVVTAGGRTRVVCAGGSSVDERSFLRNLSMQIKAGASGNATGRNVHQKSLKEAIKFCNAINDIVVKEKSVDEAMKRLD